MAASSVMLMLAGCGSDPRARSFPDIEVLMARGAGETFFIGRCAERDYGGPLRAHFGADVEKALDRIEAGPVPVGAFADQEGR